MDNYSGYILNFKPKKKQENDTKQHVWWKGLKEKQLECENVIISLKLMEKSDNTVTVNVTLTTNMFGIFEQQSVKFCCFKRINVKQNFS